MWTQLATFAAPAASAYLSYIGQRQANAQNLDEAQRNREFQSGQSNTAHQRQVADLRAAGLNPILSGTGGSGAATSAGSLAASQQSELGSGVSSALETWRNKAEVKKLDAELSLVHWSAENQSSQASLAANSIGKVLAETATAREIAKIAENDRISSDMDLAVTKTKGEQTRRTIHRWIDTIKGGSSTAKDIRRNRK